MKVILGTDLGSYSFAPLTRQISLFGIPPINLEQVVLITNVTTGAIIYNFADGATNATSLLDMVLTLDFDTSPMSASDRLQIIVDLPVSVVQPQPQPAVPVIVGEEGDQTIVYDPQLSQLFGARPLVSMDGKLMSKVAADSIQVTGVLGVIGKELRVPTAAYPVVGIQISGTWTGTILWEVSLDGGNWQATVAVPAAGGAAVASATGNGFWVVSSAGCSFVRLRASAAMTGAPMCVMLAANGGSAWPSGTDANLQTVLGAAALFRPISDVPVGLTAPVALTAAQLLLSPTRSSKDPQYFPRLRVEAGGDHKLPFAQEDNTNRLVFSSPELLRALEEINIRLGSLGNALVASGAIPDGWEEFK